MNSGAEAGRPDPLAGELGTARPICVLIASLGGEGGGVMADWLVTAATQAGLPVQSTSIPGVAQRSGATTYYVEIFPLRREVLGECRPVLALTPFPGHIDVVVASELLEAGRVMQNGFVNAQRTTLIASTHRVYTYGEKAAMGDGRADSARIVKAAQSVARRAILFDMSALAQSTGTVINAVLFGALAGSGALPLTREACERAIRTSLGETPGAAASLCGFAAGFGHASGSTQPPSAAETKRWRGAPAERVRSQFPAETRRILEEGVARLVDYQDAGYANLYLDRLQPLLAADRDAGGAQDGYRLTCETGRHLAVWMSYEDTIRVADLKTRRARLRRVRAEVLAKPGEPVAVRDFLKPGIAEICSVLPRALGAALLAWARRKGRNFNFGLVIPTHSVSGYLLLRSMAWMKPLRRASLRYAEEHALIVRWLAAVLGAAKTDRGLALEIVECARLVKGYGDTRDRGNASFQRIFETLVEGASSDSAPGNRVAQAGAIRAARTAALADPDGQNLGKALAAAKPVVWLTPRRAAALEKDA
jgi:indolepyruvate ferredoxin oxidoreductase beta subunit